MTAWFQRQQPQFERYADLLLAVVFTLFNIVIVVTADGPEGNGRDVDVLAYVLAIALSAPLAVRRRWPMAVLGIFLACLVLYNWRSYPEINVDFFGPIIAMYTVAATQSRRVSIGASGVVAVAVGLGNILDRSAGATLGDWLVAVVFISGTWLFGDSVRRRRLYAAALETRTRELEAARHELARQAVNDERLRMARELHDVVAHTLTAVVVQTAVARHSLARGPEAAAPALDTIETMSRGALDELRSILTVLRSEDADLAGLAPSARLADIDELAERLRSGGTEIAIRKEGALDGLPPLVELAAFRIVQEALTNVVKHASGARVEVTLTGTPASLAIEVHDDGLGSPRADALAGAGRGLAGMQERATLLGGTFESGPLPGGGFRVAAILPRGGTP